MKASARKKDGKWYAHVELGYDSKGKRKQITKVPERNSERSALTLAQELLAKYMNDSLIVETKSTVSEYMDVWLNKHKLNISTNTYEFYDSINNNYIIPYLGEYKLNKLRSSDIQDMIDDLVIKTKKKGEKIVPKYSSTTIKRIYNALKTALQFAVKNEIISRNSCINVTIPKQQKYKPIVLDEEQIITLLQRLSDTPIFIPCMISVYTGLRRGEVCGLKWKNVLLDKKLILVKEQLHRVKGEGLKSINKTKTEDSTRTVSISDELYLILNDWKGKQNKDKDDDYVCINKNGNPLSPEFITKKLKKIVDEIGFNGFRFHDFRHSFATLLISKGVDIKIISELLGHSTIRVTSDIYAHVLKPIQDEAVNKIKLDLNKKDKE